MEKKGWKRCQREGPIGKDRKIRRVIVTVDILLSGGRGGGSTNEKGRHREIHFKKD